MNPTHAFYCGMQVKRILIIRKHNHLGDMLCSLPLYAALKQRWPDCGITLLAAPTSWPVPLREINPYLDDIIWYNKGSWLSVVRMQLRLRRSHFDMAIVPSTIRLSRTSHITARFTGAPVRLGVKSIDGVLNPSAGWLTTSVEVAWEKQHVHQVWRNIEIAEAAGCPRPANPLALLRYPIDAEAMQEAQSLAATFPAGSRLVGVHPGAGKVTNIWPTERFADVLTSLHRDSPIGVLVSGGIVDAAAVSRLTTMLRANGIPHLVENTLSVLAAAGAQFDLFLTNDTGVMHAAAFSGAPVVSLFGPTPSWEWAPLQQGCTAIQSSDGTMQGIETDKVLAVCQATLAGMPRR